MNAKVLIVGDTSAGKTGLAQRLSNDEFDPGRCSTVGAWSTRWPLSSNHSNNDSTSQREILLWDFGGQADQRLIHQLFMHDASLVILVVDPQKSNVVETISDWDRLVSYVMQDKPVTKILVAGRCDARRWRVPKESVAAVARKRGFVDCIFETSALKNTGCAELSQEIVQRINWENIPWSSSSNRYQHISREILAFKDDVKTKSLITLEELLSEMKSRLGPVQCTDDGVKAVVNMMCAVGLIWPLQFASYYLLRPSLMSEYGQELVKAVSSDPEQRGSFPHQDLLRGDFVHRAELSVSVSDHEHRMMLHGLDHTFTKQTICLREAIRGDATFLYFPALCRMEPPSLVHRASLLVSYLFSGPADDIYSTLVIRMHYTGEFKKKGLWMRAAEFSSKKSDSKIMGFKLAPGTEERNGLLEVFFDPEIEIGEKIVFCQFIHNHLQQKNAKDIVRIRHYVCTCGSPSDNDIARQRKEIGKTYICCPLCEEKMPFEDDIEKQFADPEIDLRVAELNDQTNHALDNESKERVLVGEVIAKVSEARQICRELTTSDHGIDMEIEFKNDGHQATGQRVYLQLKSGDSHLHTKANGEEILRIRNLRHHRYWSQSSSLFFLVVRTSNGEIRWMEIRGLLEQLHAAHPNSEFHQIVFKGEPFDDSSILQWKERAFRGAQIPRRIVGGSKTKQPEPMHPNSMPSGNSAPYSGVPLSGAVVLNSNLATRVQYDGQENVATWPSPVNQPVNPEQVRLLGNLFIDALKKVLQEESKGHKPVVVDSCRTDGKIRFSVSLRDPHSPDIAQVDLLPALQTLAGKFLLLDGKNGDFKVSQNVGARRNIEELNNVYKGFCAIIKVLKMVNHVEAHHLKLQIPSCAFEQAAIVFASQTTLEKWHDSSFMELFQGYVCVILASLQSPDIDAKFPAPNDPDSDVLRLLRKQENRSTKEAYIALLNSWIALPPSDALDFFKRCASSYMSQ
eukprot:ANDGO_01871.mRNA.1 Ras-related protein Rab-18